MSLNQFGMSGLLESWIRSNKLFLEEGAIFIVLFLQVFRKRLQLQNCFVD